MKIKFKIIPFIISLLIVAGSVAGVSIFLYRDYDAYKIEFLADYANYEDTSNTTSEQLAENFVKWESKYYKVLNEELHFYDIDSNKEYTSTASNSSYNKYNGVTWENGVLHIPNVFDVKFYLEIVTGSDDSTVANVYAFIFNVNHTTSYTTETLYFTYVDGIGESGTEELYGKTKLDTVMGEIKNAESSVANSNNEPKYSYTGDAYEFTSYLMDKDAYGDCVGSESHIVRMMTFQISNSINSELDDDVDSNQSLFELENATFCLFSSGSEDLPVTSTTKNFQEYVWGTFENPFTSIEDAMSKTNLLNEGYDKDFEKAGFATFAFKKIIVWDLVAFAVSGVVAFLFYMIWAEDTPQKKPNKKGDE